MARGLMKEKRNLTRYLAMFYGDRFARVVLPNEPLVCGNFAGISGAQWCFVVTIATDALLVVYRDGALFEPVGSELSTHNLKPNHVSDNHPASVIDEYVVMSLAQDIGLSVPPVSRRYTPEPSYLIERFDRRSILRVALNVAT